jgi:predicted PurR-regulated permease PerM
MHDAIDPATPAAAPRAERLAPRRELWALAGTALLLALAWRMADVLLLLFGAVLLCLVLRRLAQPLHARLGWPPKLALAAVVLALLLLAAGGTWLAGAAAGEQLQELRQTLPRALAALRQWIAGLPFGPWLLEFVRDGGFVPEDWSGLAGLATGTLNLTVGLLGGLVLLIALGVYLAADAGLYRRGLLRLVPPRHQPLAEHTLDRLAHDLSRWLLGQAVSMAAVGALTAIGLAAIGMPLALTLAAIAAVLDFVPYFGPLASGALIVLIALTEGDRQALWALLLCVAVQQTEAYVVQPLAQRWAVRLAPVLSMLSVLVFALLFGLPGVLLGAPLMVMCVALVRCLYVERVEGVEGTPTAGQRSVPR